VTRLAVRDAELADAAACAAIYRPYVLETAITFEMTPPDAAQMRARIEGAQQAHAWLVAEASGHVVGYAYGGAFRSRPAYRYACEVSIYLETGLRRTGAGRTLYAALLERLTDQGYFTALGGITVPNEASLGLHAALGFEPVGTYRRVGWKFDRWHDVAWTQRALATGTPT
jgi:L-amino acid N-acyltransferase YncA